MTFSPGWPWKAGVEPTDAAAQLADTVRATLCLESGPESVFEQHLRNLRLWRRVTLRKARDEGAIPQAPPVLGLLAVLTLAAEEMQHDGEFAGNAYYPRLFRVLRIDDSKQQSRIKAAYRKHAEELWGGLNEWLSAADGRLGLPTAYALSHRYIGLPLSQALVRSADRRQFPLMFHRFGLPPGGEISPADMERLIDSWLQMRPCPVSKSLESLWRRGQARERIASVAAVELRSWDGALADCDPAESRKTGGVQLLCWLRRFPKRRLEISFLANLGTQASPQALTVLTATGEPSVDVLPVAGARLQPVFTSEIDTASLVEGVLRLADTSGAWRLPASPVGSSRSATTTCSTPTSSVSGSSLARTRCCWSRMTTASPGRCAASSTRSHGPASARRPRSPACPPAGCSSPPFRSWRLPSPNRPAPTSTHSSPCCRLSSPSRAAPSCQVGCGSGPASTRRRSGPWPRAPQPCPSPSTRLHEASGAPGLPHTWTSDEPTLVADIKALALPDGDYEVSLLDGGKTVQQSILRLRSSNTPDAATRRAVTPLAHDIGGDPLAVLRATPLRPGTPAGAVVRGPSAAPHRTPPATTVTAGKDVWWNAPKPPPPPPPPPITLAALDPASCVVTGAHYIELPPPTGPRRGA